MYSATKIADPAFRKQLVEGGEAAVAASTDSMIAMARRVDPVVRELHKWDEDNVESVETSTGEKLAKARFAVYGKSAYPDATFTLRLASGAVKGYPMKGTQASPFTTLYGLYDRADSFSRKPPFELPQRFVERQNQLDLSTHVDFVSTCDITSETETGGMDQGGGVSQGGAEGREGLRLCNLVAQSPRTPEGRVQTRDRAASNLGRFSTSRCTRVSCRSSNAPWKQRH